MIRLWNLEESTNRYASMMTQHWPKYVYYRTAEYYQKDVYGRLERMRKALSELQLHVGREKLERTSSMSALEESDYSKEVKRNSDSTLEQLMYQLEQQQKELEKLRFENGLLKSNAIQDKQDINEQEEEEREQSDSPLSTDISSDATNSTSEAKANINLLKRLKEAEDKAYQAESRADNLNLLLNHKLIEINKLQLTLSSQTKELIQLEKAYYQLRCHLYKTRKSSCPALRRSSSKINNTV